ncbi:hypothetical protein PAXRUDRAFT_179811, partial [Paxillus rubicundulus Ve08.2h10]
LHELIITDWKEYFEVLKRDLAAAVGQVSFTADIWSDGLHHPYLGMTAHWIKWGENSQLSLEAGLIAFHRLVGRHDGKGLVKAALAMLDRADATLKVWSRST